VVLLRSSGHSHSFAQGKSAEYVPEARTAAMTTETEKRPLAHPESTYQTYWDKMCSKCGGGCLDMVKNVVGRSLEQSRLQVHPPFRIPDPKGDNSNTPTKVCIEREHVNLSLVIRCIRVPFYLSKDPRSFNAESSLAAIIVPALLTNERQWPPFAGILEK
jgi:hypothetical protein